MPLSRLDDASGLIYQTSGDPSDPPVVYLPGVHGDWTAQGLARPILSRQYYLVETAYPRVEHWSIEDFAQALSDLLDRLGIESIHVVAESFGSLVGWQFGIAMPARLRSFTLVGGFSQAPRFRVAGIAASALQAVPTRVLESAIDSYVASKSAFGQQRDNFEMGAYPASRTPRGKRAVSNRMRIIQRSDFRHHLANINFPVRYIGGARDIVVPVRREIATLTESLPKHCEFESELVPRAPHTLIASHPEQTAEQIAKWLQQTEEMIKKGNLATGRYDANTP